MATESALLPNSISGMHASAHSRAPKAPATAHAPAGRVVTKAELLRSSRVLAWVPPHILNEFVR